VLITHKSVSVVYLCNQTLKNIIYIWNQIVGNFFHFETLSLFAA